MASNNAARASTVPPPPSPTSRRISHQSLAAVADERGRLTALERSRLEAAREIARLHAGERQPSTVPAPRRGRR